MNKRLLFLLALILLVAALFTPFFEQFVREVIVIPFLYLLWIGRFLFEAVPQAVLWAVFSMILMLIMLMSFSTNRKSEPQRYKQTAAAQGRIEPWLELIQKAERDAYFKWRLAQGLQKLALDMLAHQADLPLKQVRQQLKDGELSLPPAVLAYFQASLKSLGYLAVPRRFFSSKAETSPLDLDPAQVVQCLESLTSDSVISSNRSRHDS
jgi:hypothetical protein